MAVIKEVRPIDPPSPHFSALDPKPFLINPGPSLVLILLDLVSFCDSAELRFPRSIFMKLTFSSVELACSFLGFLSTCRLFATFGYLLILFFRVKSISTSKIRNGTHDTSSLRFAELAPSLFLPCRFQFLFILLLHSSFLFSYSFIRLERQAYRLQRRQRLQEGTLTYRFSWDPLRFAHHRHNVVIDWLCVREKLLPPQRILPPFKWEHLATTTIGTASFSLSTSYDSQFSLEIRFACLEIEDFVHRVAIDVTTVDGLVILGNKQSVFLSPFRCFLCVFRILIRFSLRLSRKTGRTLFSSTRRRMLQRRQR